ncbi:signal peptidase II [Silvanigrella aquatica]|uniref:Lipoprotein signal peptidase n=1 Tax=Silvanigrella aquatica TaxID=1915309 RepID=A0A1L4D113_9BACT|nr:signal peptidase II [Silvanigrella aquatica]APJ03902.1 signal peptidase II [Silvanigrella aquatica]
MQNSSSHDVLQSNKPKHHKLSMLGFSFLFIGFVLLDQATKFWSEKLYMVSSSLTDIRIFSQTSDHIFTIGSPSNWIQFETTYIRNTGAAWGFLGNLPENIRPYFFYILTSVAMLVILIFFFKTNPKQTLARLGIAFIFSGAAGNFIDRVWLHYVIDWIHFRWDLLGWNYDYPVFNVADCAVTCGVVLLIIDAVIDEIRNRKAKKNSKA